MVSQGNLFEAASRGSSLSFCDLISRYRIVIPKIQRDYVQGRDCAKANRAEFVKDLIASLKGRKPLSLNFIYGSLSPNGDFIPIDGQQRLTTLFLLHLYVYAKEGDIDLKKRLLSRFSYQTRYTTNRFFEKLLEKLPGLLNGETSGAGLKEKIENSGWYVTSFEDDPSIVSAIVMLDLIDAEFGDEGCAGLSKLLEAASPITFMWLPLDDSLGSDNRLYIRMNSRGKQLTDFESFKAELYEKALNGATDIDVDGFKKDIDGDWYSLLWGKLPLDLKIGEKAAWTDALLRLSFHYSVLNSLCLAMPDLKTNNAAGQGEKEKRLIELLSPYCDVTSVFVDEYKALFKDKSKTFLDAIGDFKSLFDFLFSSFGKGVNGTLFDYLMKNVFEVSKDQNKSNAPLNYKIRAYSARVLLFALSHFANSSKRSDIEAFKTYFRVVLNLVDASEIDSPLDLQKVIKAIALCDLQVEGEMDAILSNWLEEKMEKSPFRKEQAEEERFKLELMKKDPSLKKAILEAEHTDFDSPYEKRGYFSGQIGFLLHMAKSENEYDIDRFGYYFKAVNAIFDNHNYWRDYEKDYADIDVAYMENEIRVNECGFGSSFHRALLAYGDYSVPSPRSGVITYFVYSETHHNYDWLGAFRKKDGVFPKAVDCLKSLLDEYWDNEGKNGFTFNSFAFWLNGFLEDTKLPESEAKDVQDKFRRRLYCKPNYFKYICRNYYVGVFDKRYELMRLKIRRDGAFYTVPNLS